MASWRYVTLTYFLRSSVCYVQLVPKRQQQNDDKAALFYRKLPVCMTWRTPLAERSNGNSTSSWAICGEKLVVNIRRYMLRILSEVEPEVKEQFLGVLYQMRPSRFKWNLWRKILLALSIWMMLFIAANLEQPHKNAISGKLWRTFSFSGKCWVIYGWGYGDETQQ